MQVGTNLDATMWTDDPQRWRQVPVATIGSDDDVINHNGGDSGR